MTGQIKNTVNSILKGIDLIESQLKTEINLDSIAKETGYSYYHYSRVFRGITGHSPYDYILRRKLSEAAKDLVSSDKNIIDIAYDYGFKNPETFSRGFKRLFGIQPVQYRKSVTRHWHKIIMLDKLTVEHIKNRNYNLDRKPEIIELNDLSISGVITYVGKESSSSKFRKKADEDLKKEIKFDELNKAEKFYGVSFCHSETDEGFFYVFGAESSQVPITPKMVCKPLPDTSYAVFRHIGEPDSIKLTYDYIYGTWLPQSDYELFHPMEIEVFPTKFPSDEKEDEKIDIYIPLC